MKAFLNSHNLLISFILTLAIIRNSTSVRYREFHLEDDDLCSPIKKRKIRLDKGEKSALLVTHTRLNDHVIDWVSNLRCKFQLSASYSRGGVLAVIQSLRFRKNDQTGECIDYLMFKSGETTSHKYCGKINATYIMDEHYANPTSPISYDNSFIGINELDVIIFVAKEPLLTHEVMDLKIIFTAYEDCSQLHSDRNVKPCSDQYKTVCINSMFFLDNYVNCPYIGCVDEGGCLDKESVNKVKESVGNKVLIGSISSMIIMFAIFILCIWSCKRHKILCWSDEFAHPTPTSQENAQPSRVMEMNEQTGARLAEPRISTIATAPIEADKDLPPSYDSLFPANR